MRTWGLTALRAFSCVLSCALLTGALVAPAQASAGVQTPQCRAGSTHPRPVVFVHDLGRDANDWVPLARSFSARGFCVYSLNYGHNATPIGAHFPGGLRAVEDSAGQLGEFLKQVPRDRAGKVDVVAHGAGGLVAAQYLKHAGNQAPVRSLVSLGPLWHGTNLLGLASLEAVSRALGTYPLILALEAPLEDPVCAACREMIADSDLLRGLEVGGLARPGVEYTNIATAFDEVVRPPTSGFAGGMTNIRLGEVAPGNRSRHFGLPADADVGQLVYAVLSRGR